MYMYVNTKKTERTMFAVSCCRCKRRRKDEDTEDLANKCFSLKKAVDTVSVHRNHGSQHRNSWRHDKTRLSFAARLKQIAFLSRLFLLGVFVRVGLSTVAPFLKAPGEKYSLIWPIQGCNAVDRAWLI